MNHIKYRADIDGLRAIAIFAVIGYHTFPGIFRGGFVGVDVFFVISGFLISSIILRNLVKKDFRFAVFYSRRIKRIFPALIVVLMASWLFGWFVLFPDEFRQLGLHMAGGAGFMSNFVLLGEAGYFDNSLETKPLMHLWSLGIEEQFYLLCPILLWIAWKNKLNTFILAIFIAIASFAANIYFLYFCSQSLAFYSPFSRFWEIMLGVAYACFVLRNENRLQHWNRANFSSIIGGLFLFTAVGFLNKNLAFPGYWALLPTVGALMLIGSPGSWINRHVLSHKIFVYTGLISYPLYLWHWPILSFANILGHNGWETKLGCIALSFLFAWLTYEFIERATRKHSNIRIFWVLIFSAAVLLCLGFFTFKGLVMPRNNHYFQEIDEAIRDGDYKKGFEAVKIDGIDMYVKKGAKEKVLFYGDSHMEQYAPRIEKLIDQDPANTKTAILAERGGCPPILNVYEDTILRCNKNFKEAISRFALSPEIDSIVLGANWGKYFNDNSKPPGETKRFYYLKNGKKIYFDEGGVPLALQELEKFIASLSKQKKVYLVIDNPLDSGFHPKSALTGSRLQGTLFNPKHSQKYNQKQSDIRDKMIEIARRSNAIVIDPVRHLCKDSLCQVVSDDAKFIYKDDEHLRSSYVRDFAQYLDITVKK